MKSTYNVRKPSLTDLILLSTHEYSYLPLWITYYEYMCRPLVPHFNPNPNLAANSRTPIRCDDDYVLYYRYKKGADDIPPELLKE